MSPNRRLALRKGFYALVFLFAIALWLPDVSGMIGNWREARRLRTNIGILFTTDTHGFIENCGCDRALKGNLAARNAFIQQQRALRPRLLVVDNGNALDGPDTADLILSIMARDGYDAVGAGESETELGDAFVRLAGRHKMRLVRALRRGDSIDPVAEAFHTRDLAGHRIGITAAALPPEGKPYEAYRDELVRSIRDLRGKCEVLVLLSRLGLERDRDLARQCGDQGPHLIIGNLAARVLTEPEQIGSSTLVRTGPGGTHVGTVDLAFSWRGVPRLEHISVIEAEAEPDPELSRSITDFMRRHQEKFIKSIDSGLLDRKWAEGAGDVARCGKCHTVEATHWGGTRHATAMDTLINRKRLLPDCIKCHSNRYRDTGTFDHAARAGSVDCTACHPIAPSSPPTSGGASSAASRCPDRATPTQGVKTCVVCHNPQHNPSFSYVEKLPKVIHR